MLGFFWLCALGSEIVSWEGGNEGLIGKADVCVYSFCWRRGGGG